MGEEDEDEDDEDFNDEGSQEESSEDSSNESDAEMVPEGDLGADMENSRKRPKSSSGSKAKAVSGGAQPPKKRGRKARPKDAPKNALNAY